MAIGIYIEHRHRKTNWLYAVPIPKIPYRGPDGYPKARFCRLCRTAHAFKTIHLDLIDGRAIVSQEVVNALRSAGLPNLDIVGSTKDPPPIRVGGAARGASRVEQNQTNLKLTIWKPYKPKKGALVNVAT